MSLMSTEVMVIGGRFQALGRALKLEALHKITRPLFNRENASLLRQGWADASEEEIRSLWLQWYELRFHQLLEHFGKRILH